jgi:hypothetical protein
MSSKGTIAVSLAVAAALALSACAEPEDIYWTRKGASDKQFRKISLACNEQASDIVVKESGESCTYNSAGRGTYCQGVDTDNPSAVAQEKRRVERRLRYLYSQCLESAGWSKNYEGRGYKGRH